MAWIDAGWRGLKGLAARCWECGEKRIFCEALFLLVGENAKLKGAS